MKAAFDEADRLQIHSLVEDPEKWEQLIRTEIDRARADPAAYSMLESIYYEEDRARAFERFRQGAEFQRIQRLLQLFGVTRDQRICEIGGGAGWLAWALFMSGYRSIELLEPNPCFITGTGYLRSREDSSELRICNDIDAWYSEADSYDMILTHNCVHHFRGIAHAAASIRQKIRPGGRWLMLREWFADDALELYAQLRDHPYSQRYGVFEFPYPSSHYVESLELAGFELKAVIPAAYANNVLGGYFEHEGGRIRRAATRAFDAVLQRAPAVSRRLYGIELFANRYLSARARIFTRPQAMLFRRKEL